MDASPDDASQGDLTTEERLKLEPIEPGDLIEPADAIEPAEPTASDQDS